ncbi:DUF2752 domain-containing protein [Flavobacterium sp.]|uniref:DUF2752 domain-containing protein n=1 Tax=Flavobacterium sp. TaxID=239 RepID=UPI0039E69131
MTKNKLYTLLAIACFFGFVYLGLSFYTDEIFKGAEVHPCILKTVTGYPCPSCGTTRSVKLLLFEGDWLGALMMNPIGIIVGMLMVLIPIGLLYDVLSKKQILFDAYRKTEKIVTTKWIAVVLVILVILNWIWNINKNL